MSDITEKHWERARQYDGRGCHDSGDESRAGGLSWFLCRIYTEIQGQVRLAPEAYVVARLCVSGGKKGWRSCQEYAGTEACPYSCQWWGELGKAQTYSEIMELQEASLFLPWGRGSREVEIYSLPIVWVQVGKVSWSQVFEGLRKQAKETRCGLAEERAGWILICLDVGLSLWSKQCIERALLSSTKVRYLKFLEAPAMLQNRRKSKIVQQMCTLF